MVPALAAGSAGGRVVSAGVITVAEYDPAWPGRFERLRREYAQAMTAAGVPVVAIEHVDSTSVPGLGIRLRWAFKEPGRLAGPNTYVAGGLTGAERASINANQVPSHDECPR